MRHRRLGWRRTANGMPGAGLCAPRALVALALADPAGAEALYHDTYWRTWQNPGLLADHLAITTGEAARLIATAPSPFHPARPHAWAPLWLSSLVYTATVGPVTYHTPPTPIHRLPAGDHIIMQPPRPGDPVAAYHITALRGRTIIDPADTRPDPAAVSYHHQPT